MKKVAKITQKEGCAVVPHTNFSMYFFLQLDLFFLDYIETSNKKNTCKKDPISELQVTT